jgi:molybdenum cofactor biosynthesis enzyme MoaA
MEKPATGVSPSDRLTAVDRVDRIRLANWRVLRVAAVSRILAGISAVRPRPRLSLTGNGIGLARRAQALAALRAEFRAGGDRTRLTADGRLRACLFSQYETDLRGSPRAGADDRELAGLWRDPCGGKRPNTGSMTPISSSRSVR